MVLHERTLILDPDIFSGLDSAMLKELERMGARRALEVLAGHMVRVLKERRRSKEGERRKGGGEKEKGKARRKKGAGAAGAPFTTQPLPRRVGVGLGATASDKPPVAPPPVDNSQSRKEADQDEAAVVNVTDDSDREAPAAKRRKLDPTPALLPAAVLPPETLPVPMVMS